jgi:hypothetical protein
MNQIGSTRDPYLVIAPYAPSDGSADDALSPAVSCASCAPSPAPRRRSLLFLGLSGGTLLSVVGWVGLLLFEQYSESLTELRNDLKHFNELSGELVKKDSLRRLRDRVIECSKEVTESALARTALEKELAASEKSRKTLVRELNRLRERLASVEGRQAGLSAAALSAAGIER